MNRCVMNFSVIENLKKSNLCLFFSVERFVVLIFNNTLIRIFFYMLSQNILNSIGGILKKKKKKVIIKNLIHKFI